MSGRVFNRIAALVAIFSLALVVPASAQTNPSAAAYGGQQGEVLGNFNGGGTGGDVIPPPATPTGPAGEDAPTPPTPTDRTPIERGVDAPTPTPSVASGELPFTGLEAGLVALAGLALLGSGFAMRRVSRSVA